MVTPDLIVKSQTERVTLKCPQCRGSVFIERLAGKRLLAECAYCDWKRIVEPGEQPRFTQRKTEKPDKCCKARGCMHGGNHKGLCKAHYNRWNGPVKDMIEQHEWLAMGGPTARELTKEMK